MMHASHQRAAEEFKPELCSPVMAGNLTCDFSNLLITQVSLPDLL
jgi:hypothetical protein